MILKSKKINAQKLGPSISLKKKEKKNSLPHKILLSLMNEGKNINSICCYYRKFIEWKRSLTKTKMWMDKYQMPFCKCVYAENFFFRFRVVLRWVDVASFRFTFNFDVILTQLWNWRFLSLLDKELADHFFWDMDEIRFFFIFLI